jgi:uncharacterized cofD-like protein
MKAKNVVTIGGGTGSFTLLSGLKKYPINLSAIVSMADNGGSTGVLRDELGVLPPGDVRQCLVALSESSNVLRDLMNYRFGQGKLSGHNFGNLFLSALEKIEGDFSRGVEQAARILNVDGEVIPVTNQDMHLCMQLNNGKILKGEEAINHNLSIEKIGIQKNYLKPIARASKKAIARILAADLIVIGPGNHYCSVVPNLLVSGISRAINKSKAKIIYICNLVNKKGHTEKFTIADYVDSINHYLGKPRIDYAIFNTRRPDKRLIKKYAAKKEMLVKIGGLDKQINYKLIKADVLSHKKPKYHISDALAEQRSFIRHDSDKLAKVLMMILEIGDYENIIKEII